MEKETPQYFDVGCRMSDVRCRMSDVGCQMSASSVRNLKSQNPTSEDPSVFSDCWSQPFSTKTLGALRKGVLGTASICSQSPMSAKGIRTDGRTAKAKRYCRVSMAFKVFSKVA